MTPKHKGVSVFMDGQDYIVPSLSVRQFRENYELLTAPIGDKESVADFIESRVPVIALALRRNYANLSEDQVAEMVDMGNFNELLKAVQGASGMKVVTPGESQPAVAK